MPTCGICTRAVVYTEKGEEQTELVLVPYTKAKLAPPMLASNSVILKELRNLAIYCINAKLNATYLADFRLQKPVVKP